MVCTKWDCGTKEIHFSLSHNSVECKFSGSELCRTFLSSRNVHKKPPLIFVSTKSFLSRPITLSFQENKLSACLHEVSTCVYFIALQIFMSSWWLQSISNDCLSGQEKNKAQTKATKRSSFFLPQVSNLNKHPLWFDKSLYSSYVQWSNLSGQHSYIVYGINVSLFQAASGFLDRILNGQETGYIFLPVAQLTLVLHWHPKFPQSNALLHWKPVVGTIFEDNRCFCLLLSIQVKLGFVSSVSNWTFLLENNCTDWTHLISFLAGRRDSTIHLFPREQEPKIPQPKNKAIQ